MRNVEELQLIIPLRDARFCVNCETVWYTSPPRNETCPTCNRDSWVYLKQWLKTMEEAERDAT